MSNIASVIRIVEILTMHHMYDKNADPKVLQQNH